MFLWKVAGALLSLACVAPLVHAVMPRLLTIKLVFDIFWWLRH